ncbi:uncharacterized protein MYCFIDRAFT_211475 [Pseudocercospora fijiensis CIRAD86]|uniref:Extracellular membrane protein CFEM domain-containing protein n=1 Tax=Pseudocercospora fijiensis (strain CIRAD86) TaxID=383855 RepID=M3AWL2_PSEFD|nr:uncharacterized protein MYCFIDRAFT_211475 [Pseudocercospora fijiensis CIRAD86]EME81847.1 hypothetical protein MYCFIDRAFT_211475 [Pseudocercospora fijiensis CIRAD86]
MRSTILIAFAAIIALASCAPTTDSLSGNQCTCVQVMFCKTKKAFGCVVVGERAGCVMAAFECIKTCGHDWAYTSQDPREKRCICSKGEASKWASCPSGNDVPVIAGTVGIINDSIDPPPNNGGGTGY